MVKRLAVICDEDKERAQFETVHVEHHLAHIASAYCIAVRKPDGGIILRRVWRLSERNGRAMPGTKDRDLGSSDTPG